MENTKVAELLTIREVADILDCSSRTVHRYIKKGIFTPSIICNKLRFDPKEIENYIKGGKYDK